MPKMCQNQPKNSSHCTCTYETCSRKGICCECLQYHLSMRQAPACFFSAAAERSYDRSFENLMRDMKRK